MTESSQSMIDIIVAAISTLCVGYQSHNNVDNCISVVASSRGIQQITINQLTLHDSTLSSTHASW